MHELIDILFPRSNYADCYRETQSKKAREWLEEKAEIFGGNARNVLGIAEKTLEEKIDDWFKKSHGQYGSGQEWREACKKAIAEIADQHFNK